MYAISARRSMVCALAAAAIVLLPFAAALACTICIDVTKSCTDAITFNGPIQYSGTVKNCGTDVLNNVTVVDDNGTPGYPGDDVVVLGPASLAPAGQSGDTLSYSGSYIPAMSPSTNTVTATGEFGTITSTEFQVVTDTASATCKQEGGKCWLTAGGVKFSPITGLQMAEVKVKGPQDSVGGNVYPGCNADAGDGGNWNHVAHSRNLHFQGTDIEIVRCGNVAGIEPGSESPVTPYNFIEFRGTGRLVGIGGNKADFGQVCFFARAEDRNEPGNEKALLPNGGADIDRYFLKVYNCGSGAPLLLVDVDGNPSTVDPITITGGNFQLHISSCSN